MEVKRTKIKVVVVGDSSVGKTTLVNEYIKGYTPEKYEVTLFCDAQYRCTTRKGKSLLMEVWDTVGDTRYRQASNRQFYKECDAVVLMYDITNRNTFTSLPEWVTELQENSNPSLIFLIGNKKDLTGDRQVTKEEGSLFARNNQFARFMETSVASGTDANTILDEVADQLLAKCYRLDTIPLRQNQEEDSNSVWSKIGEYTSPIAALAFGIGGILFVRKIVQDDTKNQQTVDKKEENMTEKLKN